MTEEAAKPVERDEYTAKQIATRIGTDAKTLRKFFRSPASTVEPVGQGGRYVFDAADLPKIQGEFNKWNSNKKPRGSGLKRSTPKAAVEVIEDDTETLSLDDDLEDDEIDDLELEPTDDDLEEEDNVEVDDDFEFLDEDDIELDDIEEND